MVGALSRPFSSALLGGVKLDETAALTGATLNRAYLGFAALLVVAGVIALLMPGRTLRAAAQQD